MSDYFTRDKGATRDSYDAAHRRSDVDESRDALHHTLGSAPNQAAPGNHDHDDRYTTKSEFHKYDVTDLVVPASAGGISSNCKIHRRGDTVDLYIDITISVAIGAGVGLISIPVEHRAIPTVGNRYFAAVDTVSGNPMSVFLSNGGNTICTVIARTAGSGFLGIISYLAVHP